MSSDLTLQIYFLKMTFFCNKMARVIIALSPKHLGCVVCDVFLLSMFLFVCSFFLTALLTITHVTYSKLNSQKEMKYMCKVI